MFGDEIIDQECEKKKRYNFWTISFLRSAKSHRKELIFHRHFTLSSSFIFIRLYTHSRYLGFQWITQFVTVQLCTSYPLTSAQQCQHLLINYSTVHPQKPWIISRNKLR